jgi:hypothetical protein
MAICIGVLMSGFVDECYGYFNGLPQYMTLVELDIAV